MIKKINRLYIPDIDFEYAFDSFNIEAATTYDKNISTDNDELIDYMAADGLLSEESYPCKAFELKGKMFANLIQKE